MAQAGFVHALFPKAYGGRGMSPLDFALAAEELTAVDINVPTTLLATGLGMEPILGFGTDEQKRRWIGEILEKPGERLAAFAFSEASGAANFDCPDPSAGVQTFARLEGDEWVINGRKHYATNGCGWDGKGSQLITVVCRTDPTKPPAESLAVIVVPGHTPASRWWVISTRRVTVRSRPYASTSTTSGCRSATSWAGLAMVWRSADTRSHGPRP